MYYNAFYEIEPSCCDVFTQECYDNKLEYINNGCCLDENVTVCDEPISLTFIADHSGSMDIEDVIFGVRDFMKTIIHMLNYSHSEASILGFADYATVQHEFSDFRPSLVNVANIYGYPGPFYAYGSTNMLAALQLCRNQYESHNTGNRKQVVVIMTDGQPSGSFYDVTVEAELLHNVTDYTFAIGFGSEVNTTILSALASEESYVFYNTTLQNVTSVFYDTFCGLIRNLTFEESKVSS